MRPLFQVLAEQSGILADITAAIGDTPLVASFGKRKLGAAPVRLRLTLVHPVNPDAPQSVTSGILRPA